jgi:hemolysin activation/secretion protein
MRITRLLSALCLLGSAACARTDILVPEMEPAPQLATEAASAEEPTPGPVVELESCFIITVVEVVD